MFWRQRVFELGLTGRDKVHQECARGCNQRKHVHDFLGQIDKRISPLLDCIPVGHLEDDGASSASDGGWR